MQGRNEVEEILEQDVWAKGVGLPPMELIEQHEARSYRDCPIEYEAKPRRAGDLRLFLEFVGFAILVVGGTTLATMAWNYLTRHSVF